MRNLLFAALAAFAVVGLCGPASADILIDDYSQTTQFVSDPTLPGVNSTDEDDLAPGEGAGQTRFVGVNVQGAGFVNLGVNFGDNTASQASSVNASGDFIIGYDGTTNSPAAFNPTSGTLGLDFTGLTVLAIDAVSDLGSTLIFTLYNGSDAYTSQLIIPATLGLGSMTTYTVALSSFTGPGTLDLSDVDAISISSPAGPQNANDVQFTNFQATVPEPASIALLAIGGLGCAGGAWRRRRKQRTTAA